ncbi:MAG: hypothetical protein IID18_07070, partial [Nitrospinae bacterium]|nr:hypothetical protein [Nitrospinota bacterium]
LEDIDTLVGLFVCNDCKRFVNANIGVPGEKKISCPCGGSKLDWAT